MFRLIRNTCLALGCIACILGSFLFLDSTPLLIESEESKTAELNPVFNKIAYYAGLKKDTWEMQQSHQGVQAEDSNWDRISIVVDKSSAEVEFYQLSPDGQKIEFRASCYLCHSNGPRAIRPNFQSASAKISYWDQMRIIVWNMRVKTYGKLTATSTGGLVSFRRSASALNQKLESKTCVKCHKDSGIFARGTLTRQNFMPIRFMIENGYMPPPGFSLPAREKEEILKFLND